MKFLGQISKSISSITARTYCAKYMYANTYIHIDIEIYIKKSSKIKQIQTRHFKHFSLEHLWKTPIGKLSDGEKHWLKIVVGVEKDPRVLIIDDYGLHLDPKNEMILRKKLTKMNNILGTTIILSSTNDYFVKQFANVVIYLDNGHVSKVRKGYKRNSFNKSKHKNKK